jgi:hypothetical protein
MSLGRRDDTGNREEARGLPKGKTHFGRSYGPVVRQTTE